jgi:hypothetical protein
LLGNYYGAATAGCGTLLVPPPASRPQAAGHQGGGDGWNAGHDLLDQPAVVSVIMLALILRTRCADSEDLSRMHWFRQFKQLRGHRQWRLQIGHARIVRRPADHAEDETILLVRLCARAEEHGGVWLLIALLALGHGTTPLLERL